MGKRSTCTRTYVCASARRNSDACLQCEHEAVDAHEGVAEGDALGAGHPLGHASTNPGEDAARGKGIRIAATISRLQRESGCRSERRGLQSRGTRLTPIVGATTPSTAHHMPPVKYLQKSLQPTAKGAAVGSSVWLSREGTSVVLLSARACGPEVEALQTHFAYASAS